MSSVKKYLLLENSRLPRLLFKRKKRRKAVHEVNKMRYVYGEFHQLYPQLRQDSARFFEFLRMSIETFDYILTKIKDRLRKKITNFKSPVSPEEKLYVTIR